MQMEKDDLNCANKIVQFQVQLDDGLPQRMCNECGRFLCDLRKFRENCEHAQLTLKQFFNKNNFTSYESESSIPVQSVNKDDEHKTFEFYVLVFMQLRFPFGR